MRRTTTRLAVLVAVTALPLLASASSASAASVDDSCLSTYRYYAEYPVTSGDPTFVNQPGYTALYYYAFTSDFAYCVAGP